MHWWKYKRTRLWWKFRGTFTFDIHFISRVVFSAPPFMFIPVTADNNNTHRALDKKNAPFHTAGGRLVMDIDYRNLWISSAHTASVYHKRKVGRRGNGVGKYTMSLVLFLAWPGKQAALLNAVKITRRHASRKNNGLLQLLHGVERWNVCSSIALLKRFLEVPFDFCFAHLVYKKSSFKFILVMYFLYAKSETAANFSHTVQQIRYIRLLFNEGAVVEFPYSRRINAHEATSTKQYFAAKPPGSTNYHRKHTHGAVLSEFMYFSLVSNDTFFKRGRGSKRTRPIACASGEIWETMYVLSWFGGW